MTTNKQGIASFLASLISIAVGLVTLNAAVARVGLWEQNSLILFTLAVVSLAIVLGHRALRNRTLRRGFAVTGLFLGYGTAAATIGGVIIVWFFVWLLSGHS
jgi:hypothetical protein